jgi:hypothetical protein
VDGEKRPQRTPQGGGPHPQDRNGEEDLARSGRLRGAGGGLEGSAGHPQAAAGYTRQRNALTELRPKAATIRDRYRKAETPSAGPQSLAAWLLSGVE